MQKKTDLYLCDSVRSERLKFIKIFDKEFLYDADKSYVGYLGINVDRVKLVSVVSDLRKHRIVCFSAPIDYRDRENISPNHALNLANDFAKTIGASALDGVQFQLKCPPVYWTFGLKYENPAEEKIGGVVMIDRLDGHVWSDLENEEYMYDYNNLL